MSLSHSLSGKTRVFVIVGDPIAQVKSPAGVTQRMVEAGADAVLVPAHVAPADLATYMQGAAVTKNCDGIIVTIPHKFSTYTHCKTATPRAEFLGATNILRRNADGSWHGDMVDGLGMIGAVQAKGGQFKNKRVLLVGAGGAGSAIALAALEAGASQLAIHDGDVTRRDSLIERLNRLYAGRVIIGSSDPTGFDCVLNATPMGMKADDPLPVQVDKLSSATFCGCAITSPPVSPWIEAARMRGCNTSVGGDMFASLLGLMIDFLLYKDQ